MTRIFHLTLLFVAFSLPANSSWSDTSTLFPHIAERLGWMKSVAAWKRANDVPVEDLDREAVVLNAVVADAAEHGLDPNTIRTFFQAQISAAKDIQSCWMDRWETGTALAAETPDLVVEVRPELLRLGNEIIADLAFEVSRNGQIPARAEDGFRDVVQVECMDRSAQSALFDSLTQVRSAP